MIGKDRDEFVYPKPFSDTVWENILLNSQDPPMVCGSLKKFENDRIEELIKSIEEKNWKTGSSILSELRMAGRFSEKCQGFLRE